MRFQWFSLLIVFCAMPLISPAGDNADKPLKKTKIGDYLAYKVTYSDNGKDYQMSIRQTVIAKNEKELTVQTVHADGGKTLGTVHEKIDAAKPYDPIPAITAHAEKVNWEKTGDGKEKVKIGDKTYDCTWISGKGVYELDGAKIVAEMKVWSDKSVPLTGLVKIQFKSALVNMRLEITESGSAK